MNKSEYYETHVQPRIDSTPHYVRSNVFSAMRWAKDKLMRFEGEGHCIYISRASSKDQRIVCSFAKPSWPGDHCGSPQDTGAMAIVVAVHEYMCGL